MSAMKPIFRKSSRSQANGGNCVEVASNVPNVVLVRDSKDQAGPVLSISPEGWGNFIQSVR